MFVNIVKSFNFKSPTPFLSSWRDSYRWGWQDQGDGLLCVHHRGKPCCFTPTCSGTPTFPFTLTVPSNRREDRVLFMSYRLIVTWLIMSVPNLCLQVFSKLIRRYKYLEKAFEEEIKKVKPPEYVVISDMAEYKISPYSPCGPPLVIIAWIWESSTVYIILFKLMLQVIV